MVYLIAMLVVVALGLGGFGVHKWDEASILKAETARQAAEQGEKNAIFRARRMQENLDESERIRRQREKEKEGERQRAEIFAGRLDELAQTEANKPWLGGLIPLDVRGLRRSDAGCSSDLLLPCPTGGVIANPGTLDAGPDGKGPSGGSEVLKGQP